MYAQLCKRLSEEAPNFEPPGNKCTFLRLLLNVCYDKFENRSTHIITSLELNKKHQQQLKQQQQLQQQLQQSQQNGHSALSQEDEEKKHVAKQKMLGNVKFIGELCKLDMLSESILHRCILQLLDKNNRKNPTVQDRCEDMECLSQLIRTCGKNLDTEQGKMLMDQYFEKMAHYSHASKYPPRIRFMLRDVIELRRNNWKPRKVATTEGPMPMHQLRNDDDIIRPGYVNRNRDMRNNERDGDNWMNRLPLNIQSGFNDMMFSSLGVSSPSHILPSSYSTPSNNYNNRDHRGDNNGGNGGYRNHQNSRNNQNHNNYNNRYNNKHNNNNHHGNIGNNNMHNNSSSYNSLSGNNIGGNGSSLSANNMLNNKDLAPRFKRNLITTTQDPVENLQMRPAANSLLFKAHMNIKTQLPLSLPKMHNNNIVSGNLYGGGNHTGQQNINNSNDTNNYSPSNNNNNSSGQHQQNNQLNYQQQQQQQHQNNHNQQQQQPQQQSAKLQNQQLLTPINNILNKDQILIKQASLEKPKQNKKDKGPSKDEIMKKVIIFINDNLNVSTQTPTVVNLETVVDVTSTITDSNNDTAKAEEVTATTASITTTLEKNIDDIVTSFLDIKVPDKYMKDSIITILNEIIDKTEQIHERTIQFLLQLRKENKLNNNYLLESIKLLINNMNERESTIPRITTIIAIFLSRCIQIKLFNLNDITQYTENGQNYPLFLLILQQLHKTMGKQLLLEKFNQSKINLMLTLPEIDRTKDRMAEILEDRNLSFLYPLLKVQGELMKQINIEPNPQQFYKWIKENVDATCFTDNGFITALMTVLLKYITQETTLADGIDATKNPDKVLIEKEKQLLEKYCPVLDAFLNCNTNLQLIAIYALQVFCYSVDFPKGMLLRWFTALYDLNVIEEESFLKWKEDITDLYPGKGRALFQVNSWLTWLQDAESEEDED